MGKKILVCGIALLLVACRSKVDKTLTTNYINTKPISETKLELNVDKNVKSILSDEMI